MQDEKAENAADCYVMLAESVERARRLAVQRNLMAPKPDVRTENQWIVLDAGSTRLFSALATDTVQFKMMIGDDVVVFFRNARHERFD